VVIPFEFCRNLQHQKTRVPGLSCGVVYVILRLAILVEHRLLTEGHTTTAYTALAWRRAVTTTCPNLTTFFVCYLWPWHSSSASSATRYVLPVLWMMSCYGNYLFKRIPVGIQFAPATAKLQLVGVVQRYKAAGEVCCPRLPYIGERQLLNRTGQRCLRFCHVVIDDR